MFQSIQIPTTNTIISAAASAAAAVVLLRSYVPNELKHYLSATLRSFLASFSNQLTLIIDEYDGLRHNHLFSAADTYLGSLTPRSSPRFKLSMPPKESNFKISVERNQQVSDTFASVEFTWTLVSRSIGSRSGHSNSYEITYFELSFHKKHRDLVLNTYLSHVLKQSEAVAESKKTLKIFTLKYDRVVRHGSKIDPWQSVTLDHPATFDSLAMESEAKKAIMEDLDRFLKRKEMYRSVGKAWKRGYLLFGPPGTGKSSLIAAIANYLKFDVYDLELTDLRSNSQLRKLLISTANRSILVVEDIDCSLELQDRRAKSRAMNPGGFNGYNDRNQEVTLSGLLNFIDGLWSSCGDERIIIFTTNHKNRLDPALLRPGRMDYHIHMSYCTPCGFKILASNYLGITEHPLFSEVQHLIQIAKVTPADIGEQLMKSEDPEVALRGLIYFLRTHKETKASDSKKGVLVADALI